MNLRIKLSLQDIGEREETLAPHEDGYYHIPLEWRYIIENPPLDSLLKAVGLSYVRRPPNKFYELWVLRVGTNYSYDAEGDLRINHIAVTTPPANYTGPTF